jgi:multicomponent Na+:H+ antiporter subunit D
LFFWLPASYHTPPVAVSAIFAGLLTKVGVYSLLRVFTLMFTQEAGFTHNLLLVIAGLTMLTGVLGAAAQSDIRRILSFHIVSQIGYMIMGLGLYTRLALAGTVFYLIHHIIVKTNLFLVSGIVHRLRGTYLLKELGGLYTTRPALAILFMIPAMSLAGIPPLSGFFAKLGLVVAGLDKGAYIVVTTALVVSILTLFSMTKIWAAAFWSAVPAGAMAREAEAPEGEIRALMAPVAVLAAMTVIIGLGAEYFFGIALRAADQLLDSEAYVRAVLGVRP